MNDIVSLSNEDMAQFTGSCNWFSTPLSQRITYTDGVRCLIHSERAQWLISDIIALQRKKRMRPLDFQVWELKTKGGSAILTCSDDEDNVVFTKYYDNTDFPLEKVTIWHVDDVLLLPNEY